MRLEKRSFNNNGKSVGLQVRDLNYKEGFRGTDIFLLKNSSCSLRRASQVPRNCVGRETAKTSGVVFKKLLQYRYDTKHRTFQRTFGKGEDKFGK